ncbi:exo-alpha-sialidase [Acuticoccus sp. MNP-M23]|uniref:sialidase family protein n=1 Tax=Acuticoccus sp. MNP-M23 TaxID=3072793 RepID=UPI002814E036|nr:exo-alpha-sialidase [Acuticoccus sp. MNP-M23]WMS40919.1 exo-alpha-sialidase [Acuticoccus sp. MNP-M23]
MADDTRFWAGNAPPSPQAIAAAMSCRLAPGDGGVLSALLPSPQVQNHAPFVAELPGGDCLCLWFAGSLEGARDIAIHGAILPLGSDRFGPTVAITDDPVRSEQNPLLVIGRTGGLHLINTAQPSGHQDRCALRHRRLAVDGTAITASEARDLPLPRGTFVRSPVHVGEDGRWLIPLFRCNPAPGEAWTGRYDTAAVGISRDEGATIEIVDVPGSVGCVHMAIVADGDHLAAFFRRRQADWIHRSESVDGGASWSVPASTDCPNNNSSLSAIALADGRIAIASNPTSASEHSARRASLYDELDGDDAAAGEDEAPAAVRPREACTPVWGIPRAPLSISVSADGGRTFPLRRVVEDGPGTCLTNNSLDGQNHELSYPSLVQRADGGLDLAYTFHRRAIKFTRLPAGWIDGETRGGESDA